MSVIALLWVSAASADEYGGPGAGNVYLSPGVFYLEPPDNIGIDDPGIGPGGIIGFGVTDRVSVEFLLAQNKLDYTLPGGVGSDNADVFWGNILWKPTKSWGPWQSFFLAGGGRSEFSFDNVQDEIEDTQFHLGAGLFGALTPRFSLRADVRANYSDEEGNLTPAVFVGLTGILGAVEKRAPIDTDGDGVADRKDKCPNTPPGRTVNENGCQLDADGDGVVDGDDRCPNTPAGTTVDNNGCPPDVDSDGDGVPDRADDCPDTPAGVSVDGRGCPLDSDGDGVPDYLDKCPGSSAGAKVDAEGCYIELTETVTIDLNLKFDSNSDTIRADERGKIEEVVEFLRQYPTTSAVLEGHTDSDGSQAYNQQLSERRARSVYNYLISEKNIDANRLSFVGYGETRPIASNENAAGKQENRRVSAVISATRTVRQ